MGLFRRRLPTSIPAHCRPLSTSTSTSAVTSSSASTALPRHVRDRGLDHAVEREKHRRTVIDLKNLLKSEPTKSLPVSIISRKSDALRIPTRLVEFLRRFPSVFAEFRPGNLPLDPHFKLTDEVLGLDEEEKLVYQSNAYRQEAADRVLRLLMLGRKCEMPLGLVNCLGWDMGLPPDFSESITPEFPDYFRVLNDRIGRGSGGGGVLELVCWSGDLTKSAVERKVKKGGDSGRVEFEMQFSKGFEMDKKMKKWFDEWQKLPYVSPYESGYRLESKSEEAEKWGVGFLHELLHLFIPKKAEKDTAFLMGEYFGIRSKFKRAMLCHPGIFYLSSKNRTHTVVLKESFKRGSLVEMHPLMNVRNKYIHLMNTVKEDRKSVGLPGSTGQSGKVTHKGKHREEEADKIGEVAPRNSVSSSEVDDDNDDNAETDDESNDEEDVRSRGVGRSGSCKAVWSRERMSRNGHSSSIGQSRRLAGDKPFRKLYMQKFDKSSPGDSTRKEGSVCLRAHACTYMQVKASQHKTTKFLRFPKKFYTHKPLEPPPICMHLHGNKHTLKSVMSVKDCPEDRLHREVAGPLLMRNQYEIKVQHSNTLLVNHTPFGRFFLVAHWREKEN